MQKMQPLNVKVVLHMSYTVKDNPCFKYERKTGEERILFIFKDTFMNCHGNGEALDKTF